MTTRAKFRCDSVTSFTDASRRTYTFSAVYDASTPENARFTKYTPWGELKMTVDNPEVEFTPGQEYYVDFTSAATAS